jgi:hypothetical protein
LSSHADDGEIFVKIQILEIMAIGGGIWNVEWVAMESAMRDRDKPAKSVVRR